MTNGTMGLRLLRGAMGVIAAFAAFAGGWLLWAAAMNPDVRLKKPSWVADGFDHSFWIPVLVVTLGGAALVGAVLWTAYRRLKAGEDLYDQRAGRGIRRRGERHLDP